MTIPLNVRQRVRERANFACEFCSVRETDTGDQLTLDHFQPKAKGGDDSFDNLIYCCVRCNQYKLDYWPAHSDDPKLWNPRIEPFSKHFLEFDDGTLYPLTPTGTFTLRRLRLNRLPLVAYRLNKRQQAEEAQLLIRYRDLVDLLEQLNKQMSVLMEEQQRLLKEQRDLLRLLVDRKD